MNKEELLEVFIGQDGKRFTFSEKRANTLALVDGSPNRITVLRGERVCRHSEQDYGKLYAFKIENGAREEKIILLNVFEIVMKNYLCV